MTYILTFEAFILKQNFNPLYHYTYLKNLNKILSEDKLAVGQPTYPENKKSVCFSRNKN
jgi:hypothetical protein